MTTDNLLSDMKPSGPDKDGWAPPLPLESGALPTFPVSLLTPWMADYANAVSVAVQVPLDLVAPLTLAVVSATVARKVVVEVKPEYYEPLNIWTVAPLESGNRKTQCVRLLVAPLRAWEATRAEGLRDRIAEEQTRARIKAAALSRAERQAATGADHNARLLAEAEALDLATQVGRASVSATPRLLAADTTPEAFVSLLAEHDGRIAIIVSEGDIFELMAGRYSNSVPNIGHYLNAHVGEDIDVDRQGRAPQHVTNPALTMGITPQPSAMQGLTAKPGFLGRGLLNRFLYATPTSWLGQRDTRAPAVSREAREAYARKLNTLLDIPMPSTGPHEYNPHVLHLDTGALAMHEALEDSIEPRLGERGDLYAIRGWGSKLAGAVARLAAVLHMARYGAEGLSIDIDAGTMGAAIGLGQYFIPHTLAAFRAMAADERIEGARQVLAWIHRSGKTTFTRRDAWQALRRRFGGVEELDGPLALLCLHGYIREKADPADLLKDRDTRGRPSPPHYDVNPLEAHEPDEIILCTPRVQNVYSTQASQNSANGAQNGLIYGQFGKTADASADTDGFSVYSVYAPDPSSQSGEHGNTGATLSQKQGIETTGEGAPETYTAYTEKPPGDISTRENGQLGGSAPVHTTYTERTQKKINNIYPLSSYSSIRKDGDSYVNNEEEDEGDLVE